MQYLRLSLVWSSGKHHLSTITMIFLPLCNENQMKKRPAFKSPTLEVLLAFCAFLKQKKLYTATPKEDEICKNNPGDPSFLHYIHTGARAN